ncbi:MAG: helix-hairpin-helix domain-containing protein [Chloroflexota bacterium]|nr:helix-hairpin-helix domain-containing protein [Chloroflexota bacterium]
MSENILVDPNTADEETLAQIPGVGEEMAKRILNARPYASLDDLQRVNGIGQVFLENIASYLIISPAEAESVGEDEQDSLAEAVEIKAYVEPAVESLPAKEEEESPTEAGKLEAVGEPPAKVTATGDESEAIDDALSSETESEPVEETPLLEKEPPTEPTQPTGISRGQSFWISTGCSFFAVILAIVITLGIIAGLNYSNLIFASPEDVSGLGLQVDNLEKVVQGIRQDMDSVQMRVDNLEALSGRLNEVEQNIQELKQEMDNTTAQVAGINKAVDDLNQQVEDLTNEVASLQADSERYQGFFQGLKELLGELLTSEEDQNEQ